METESRQAPWLSVGLAGALVLVLGFADEILTLGMADSMEVEWSCLFGDSETASASAYFTGVLYGIPLSGITLVIAIVAARRRLRRGMVSALSVAWFMLAVAAALIAAAPIGAQPCRG